MAKAGTHLHGCPKCKDTFVCGCRDLKSDPSCVPCVCNTGRTLAKGRQPIKCCVRFTRLARKDELALYRLAGSKPWFICAECKRAFIYQPKEN